MTKHPTLHTAERLVSIRCLKKPSPKPRTATNPHHSADYLKTASDLEEGEEASLPVFELAMTVARHVRHFQRREAFTMTSENYLPKAYARSCREGDSDEAVKDQWMLQKQCI